MGKLTDEAQAAIDEAIRIVREDRWEKFMRESVTKHTAKPDDKPADPPKPPEPGTGNPPADPPPPKPQDDPPADPPKRKSLWWGEMEDS